MGENSRTKRGCSSTHFSFCFPSCPSSRSFPMSWLFISGGQSIGASALASVLPMDIQDWFPLELTGLNSLVQRTLNSLQCNSKTLILGHSSFFMVQLSHLYETTGKSIALTIWTFVGKVMSLLFNTQSRFVIAFLLRSKGLLISWLQSLSTMILEPKKIKSVTDSNFYPSFCHEVMGLDAMILAFWMLSFKPTFSLFSLTFIKRLFSCSSLSAIREYYLHISGYWYFSQQSWC